MDEVRVKDPGFWFKCAACGNNGGGEKFLTNNFHAGIIATGEVVIFCTQACLETGTPNLTVKEKDITPGTMDRYALQERAKSKSRLLTSSTLDVKGVVS
jgi:hypothetical protein